MKIFVMAKKVLKSLCTRPVTFRYPFVPKTYYKFTRGSITIDINRCIYCGMCQRKCPAQAILVTKDNKEWKIDRLRCVSCGYCVDVCPVKCLFMENTYSASTQTRTEEVFRRA
ncbi:MAG: 4Fe-4S binding protein [Candidatus Omnitrophica bacterium]|nr:4Fe-4S binding protein [Candidatus Omnitrophota bacterium]